MTTVFTLIIMSSLFTGLIMLILCASDHRLGTKLSPKKRTIAATLTLALQPVMLAVATALSFAQDIFGKVEETITETVTPASTGTTVTDNFVATVTSVTEATTSAVQDTPVSVTVSSAPDFETILTVIAWIWLAGVTVTAIYKIVSYLRFTHSLKKSLIKCDIEAKAPVFTSQMAASPFLMGFFRAKIILPEKPMDESELDLAIRHELIHHKRHDIQKKFFAEMLKCLNWFNPAFYVYANKLSELSELTVDEILSSDLDYTGRKAYGGLLLKFASQKQESVLCTDLSKGAKSLAERLRLITEDGKRKTTKGEKIALGILSAVTLAVIGVSVAFCMTAVPELEVDSREIIYLDESLAPTTEDVVDDPNGEYYVMDEEVVYDITVTDPETTDLSGGYLVEPPHTLEDGPENPLLDADFTGCSVYVERWVYGFFDEPALLDDESAENIISIIESMELDRLPSEIDIEGFVGYSTASLYTIVLADGTEHGVGEVSAYYHSSPTEEVYYSCLIVDGYFYLMSDEGRELLSEFRQSWLKQYKHDSVVLAISRNEYKYNLVHSIGEWEYERNKQDMIDNGSIESEEEYYEILAGIDDVTKHIVPGT